LTSEVYNINDCGIKESTGTLILADKNQNIWYADNYHGLSRYNNGTWTNYNPDNSEMPFWYVGSMSIDSDGVLWFGGSSYGENYNCLNSFDGTIFTSYYYPQQISIFYPIEITNTPDKKVWFLVSNSGSAPKLYHFSDGNFTEVPLPTNYNAHYNLRSTDDARVLLSMYNSIGNTAIGIYNGTDWEIIDDEITNSSYFNFTTYKNELYATGSDGLNYGIFQRENNSWKFVKEIQLNYGGTELEVNDDIIVAGLQVYQRSQDTVYQFNPFNSPIQFYYQTDITIDQSNHIWWTESGITTLDYTTLPTGIENSKLPKNNLSIYPNPVSSGAPFYANLESGKEGLIEIYDMNGRQLFKSPITSAEPIRPPSFNIGVYVVKIVSEKGVTTTKLVVNR
jgi:hypothetical protein